MLSEVERLVSGDGVEELTRFVVSHIREHEKRPAIVDERAVEILRGNDEALPTGSSLQNV